MRRTFLSALSAVSFVALAACSSSPSRHHATAYRYQNATPAIASNGGLAVGDQVAAVAFPNSSNTRVASVPITQD